MCLASISCSDRRRRGYHNALAQPLTRQSLTKGGVTAVLQALGSTGVEGVRLDGVKPRDDQGLEIGWEAGIRTPITCSRGRCPTVGRPPSASRCASTSRTVDYSQSKTGPASAAPGSGLLVRRVNRLWQILRLWRLFLLAVMAGHSALTPRLARLFARPLVRSALLMCRSPTLACYVALSIPVHGSKSAILFGHFVLLLGTLVLSEHLGCNRCAAEKRPFRSASSTVTGRLRRGGRGRDPGPGAPGPQRDQG